MNTRSQWRAALAAHEPGDIPKGRPRAAVSAVLQFQSEDVWVLLMRRAERAGDPWSGHISLPGGREATADTTLLETARRETHEEVGVALQAESLLTRMKTLAPYTRSGPAHVAVVPYVFEISERPPLALGEEATDAFWFPLLAAARGDFAHSYLYEKGENRMRLPAWQFEGAVIWGLTYRILQLMMGEVGAIQQ